jgi:hypothetical protein
LFFNTVFFFFCLSREAFFVFIFCLFAGSNKLGFLLLYYTAR